MKAVAAVLPFSLLVVPLQGVGHDVVLDTHGCHPHLLTGRDHCLTAAAPRRSAPKPTASAIRGPVTLVSVGDGDTIRVMDKNGKILTVRLACIDAPETAQGQSGADATQGLKALLATGSPLDLRPKSSDKFGRTVAEVYAGGRNVNLEMVRLGFAYAYRDYLKGCDAKAYTKAEEQAERDRQGVWGRENETKPWVFREQC